MRIVLKHKGEADEIATCKCGAELSSVPVCEHGVTRERTQFAFAMTHRKDGSPIKHLKERGAFLAVIELAWCDTCQQHMVVLDSTEDKAFWSSLPKWEQPIG
jgi:hypothetical protein